MKGLYTTILLGTLIATAYSLPHNQPDETFLERVLNRLTKENAKAEISFDSEADTQVNYHNGGDAPFTVECDADNGEAIHRIQSEYITINRDRKFKFSCVKIADTPGKHCEWFNDVNEWQKPLVFTCPADYYISGIKSVHLNQYGYEDRQWSIKCCRSDEYHVESCELTDYINNFQETIDYVADLSVCDEDKDGAFFTGFYSYFDTQKTDRRWRIYQCKAGKAE